jgi:hypothetical protein
VCQQQVAQAASRNRIFGRKLDDFAKCTPAFCEQLGLLGSGFGARSLAQVQLAHGGAHSRVGVGPMPQLARQVGERGAIRRIFVGVE